MPLDDLNGVLKGLRRQPLCGAGEQPARYDSARLLALLPHRPPFLLIDAVEAVDSAHRTIRGTRKLQPDDPVFAGHFPGHPIYPGVLQIEMMGQLGICLAGLLSAPPGGAPPRILMTKVLHAMFLEPLLPRDDLTIHATLVENDDLIVVTAGQIYKGSRLAAVAVQEGCHAD